MISKAQISLIRSLDRKKAREEEGCLVAEGDKIVSDLLDLPPENGYRIRALFGIDNWLNEHRGSARNPPKEVTAVSEFELLKISHLKTPNKVLAIVELPVSGPLVINPDEDLIIGLDQVQDPGNAGTIIRLADWFGIAGVIFSLDSADLHSPKVVQASMGSVFHVKLAQVDLLETIKALPAGFPVYGTGLSGENIYSAGLSRNGLILLGNEAKGLDSKYARFISQQLRIPGYSSGSVLIDSLNVAIAAALICGEFRRRSTV